MYENSKEILDVDRRTSWSDHPGVLWFETY